MADRDPSAAALGGQLKTPKQPFTLERDIGFVLGTPNTGACPRRESGAVADWRSGRLDRPSRL